MTGPSPTYPCDACGRPVSLSDAACPSCKRPIRRGAIADAPTSPGAPLLLPKRKSPISFHGYVPVELLREAEAREAELARLGRKSLAFRLRLSAMGAALGSLPFAVPAWLFLSRPGAFPRSILLHAALGALAGLVVALRASGAIGSAFTFAIAFAAASAFDLRVGYPLGTDVAATALFGVATALSLAVAWVIGFAFEDQYQ